MIGMEEELVVLDNAKDLDFSKEMYWDYTMVENTFEYYMHQNFDQVEVQTCWEGFWCSKISLIDEA
jgi:hypothetical protein